MGQDDQPFLVLNAGGTTPGTPPAPGKADEQAVVVLLSRRWKVTPLGAPLLLLLAWRAAARAGEQPWLCTGCVQPRRDPHGFPDTSAFASLGAEEQIESLA